MIISSSYLQNRCVCSQVTRSLSTSCVRRDSLPPNFYHRKTKINEAEPKTGFLESSDDFKFVERLIPSLEPPTPPVHEKYPTPSGWSPPTGRLVNKLYVHCTWSKHGGRNDENLLQLLYLKGLVIESNQSYRPLHRKFGRHSGEFWLLLNISLNTNIRCLFSPQNAPRQFLCHLNGYIIIIIINM